MKKLKINGKTVRQDGLYYCLTDLFRLSGMNGLRLGPWDWAIAERVTVEISRRGWIFKKCWAKDAVFLRYAHYLKTGLYRDALDAIGADEVEEVLRILGRRAGSELDPRVRRYVEQKDTADMADRVREHFVKRRVEFPRKLPAPEFPDTSDVPLFRAEDLPEVKEEVLTVRSQRTGLKRTVVTEPKPVSSIQHHRSGSPSVQHHRSEPDYFTTAMMMNAMHTANHSHIDHHHHHSSSDTCSSSYDSGSSYDSSSYSSGSSGCD